MFFCDEHKFERASERVGELMVLWFPDGESILHRQIHSGACAIFIEIHHGSSVASQ